MLSRLWVPILVEPQASPAWSGEMVSVIDIITAAGILLHNCGH